MQLRLIKNFQYSIFIILVVLSFGQSAYSQDSANNQTHLTKVTDELYVLKRVGCNVAGLVGQDGALIIDSGARNQSAKTISMLKEIFGEPVRIVINTHFHYDHAGGNEAFAKDGATIVAHKNTRIRMTQEWQIPEILGMKYPKIQPYPEIFLPKVSFNESLTIHFNNETIQAIHIPDGHSDSDIIVHFRKANVIHTGDLYLSNGFPIIDIHHGGSVNGYIAAVDKIIRLCNENTKIIPGHGPLSDRDGLIAYRDMLALAKDRIEILIKEGHTLEEIVAAEPTSGLYHGGKSWLPPKLFIYCVYHDFFKSATAMIMVSR
jgi:glyoxylase-like metal-dependent hydrolase (beta-lactamase superfamily II)